ncbi:MAG: peroxiredoxin [Muribaculaceae bacterium]|nr:peroxiredoxin [Muribaculaceae bacterium]
MKNIGDKINDLLGLDADGNEIRLSNYPGKKIALYFYPKDNTPGCTAQACDLRDNYKALLDAGYQVIGVSIDSAASHKKFIEKHSLPFPLITDPDHKMVEEWGVWDKKKLAGREYMGTLRTTFIISPEATIERIIPPKQIKTKIHASLILKP